MIEIMESQLLLQFVLGVAIILSAELISHCSVRAYNAYKKTIIQEFLGIPG